jgi:hypothetical protein
VAPAVVGFVVGCGWFGVFFAAHIVAMRSRPVAGVARVLAGSIGSAGVAATATVVIVPAGSFESSVLAEIYAMLWLACLFVLYSPFLYAIATSLSIQSIVLLKTSGGRLPIVRLTNRFASPSILEVRLQSLVDHHYLERRDGRYAITARGLAIGNPFAALKELWRLGPGG